jgi:phage baseplate assembly protein W
MAIGIVLPIERGSLGYFRQSFTIQEQSKSNLINLMLTKRGERVMQPTFGCTIHEKLFSNITPQVEAEIRSSIQEAVNTWMPYINLENIQIRKEEIKNSIFIKIDYSIVNVPNSLDSVVLTF